MIYINSALTIFFGDKVCSIDRELFKADKTQLELKENAALASIKKQVSVDTLFFTKQIHSAQGFVISQDNYSYFVDYQPEGDFLITDKAHAGLGVYTADCLPIVIYDPEHHAVAICHAGWMGSVKQIALKALLSLENTYGTKKEKVQIFFGPAAGVCCYKVQQDFKNTIQEFSFRDQVIVEREGQLFFDLALFNKLHLLQYGVKLDAFNQDYNLCTIHNLSFCSYRRDSKSSSRHVTLVALTRVV
jgi:YfiH family protein